MDVVSYLLGKEAGGGSPTSLQEKSVTINSNGESSVTPDSGYDGLSKVNLTTNVQPDLESKSITITENTTTTISPTSGYDGLSEVEVITNVSGGSSDWSNIGWNSMPPSIHSIYDVTKAYYDNWNPSSPTAQYFYGVTTLRIAPGIDTQNLTTFLNFFYNCYLLTDVPSYDTTSNTTYRSMFQGCSALKSVDISSYSTANFVVGQTGSLREMFSGCSNLEDINFGGFQTFDPSKTNNVYNMFNNCTKLSNNTLNDILELCIIITPNVDASNRKLATLGINSSFDNWNNIENLSNYTAFQQAGWITA